MQIPIASLYPTLGAYSLTGYSPNLFASHPYLTTTPTATASAAQHHPAYVLNNPVTFGGGGAGSGGGNNNCANTSAIGNGGGGGDISGNVNGGVCVSNNVIPQTGPTPLIPSPIQLSLLTGNSKVTMTPVPLLHHPHSHPHHHQQQQQQQQQHPNSHSTIGTTTTNGGGGTAYKLCVGTPTTILNDINSLTVQQQQQHHLQHIYNNNKEDEINAMYATALELSCSSQQPDDPTLTGDNKTNLIVNYLPQNMTQEEIRALFATVGDIDSCKLIRDKNTGQSLGYGFVNYVDADDAGKAIKFFNGMRLQNKIIKVSLARPSSEAMKGANLYICSLPKTMTQTQMESLFSSCGKIITSRILHDPSTGLSKGVGFIRFNERSEADRAIKDLNGHVPSTGCEPIVVKFANSPSHASVGKHLPLSTIGGGTTTVVASTPQLYEITNREQETINNAAITQQRRVIGAMHHIPQARYRFNPLEGSHVSTGGSPRRPQSRATTRQNHKNQGVSSSQTSGLNPPNFVVEYLLAAHPGQFGPIPTMNDLLLTSVAATGHPVDQCTIVDPNSSSFDHSLVVQNLPPDVDDFQLRQLFTTCGTVQCVRILRETSGTKCASVCAIVLMGTIEEALLALQRINGFILGNRIVQVHFQCMAHGIVPNPLGGIIGFT